MIYKVRKDFENEKKMFFLVLVKLKHFSLIFFFATYSNVNFISKWTILYESNTYYFIQ